MLHEESEEHPIWPESEGTPLLRTDSAEDPRDKLRPRVVALCFVVMFFFELGACLWLPAANAMLERRICHDVYSGVIDTALLSGDVDSPCKSTAVQGKLAMLRGWQSSIDCIPGLLTIVPYGILSDTWGRKRVLALANFGVLLMLGFQIAICELHGGFFGRNNFLLIIMYQSTSTTSSPSRQSSSQASSC